MTFEHIKTLVSRDIYFGDIVYPIRTKNMVDGYITDENKSVKWNREQVNLANEKYRNAYNKAKDLRAEREAVFEQDLIRAIVDVLKCTVKQAKFIIAEASERYDDCYEIVLEAENLADFISGYNNLK